MEIFAQNFDLSTLADHGLWLYLLVGTLLTQLLVGGLAGGVTGWAGVGLLNRIHLSTAGLYPMAALALGLLDGQGQDLPLCLEGETTSAGIRISRRYPNIVH